MNPCPPWDHLSRFLEERLSDPERQALITHVEACRSCQRALESLTNSILGQDGTPLPPKQVLPVGGPDHARTDTPTRCQVANQSVSDLSRFVASRAGQDTGRHADAGRVPRPAVAGYEILEELGRGGMGVVYKARQISLKRVVALKMILIGGHAGREHLSRFRAEAEAVARLQHPNIVQIHEIGEQDGLPYFSLEFVDGGSLARLLNGQPLPGPPSARLVEILARAMHYAHERGIIHRDLKPGNILLDCRLPIADCRLKPEETGEASPEIDNRQSAIGNPKITDFGLAKQLITLTSEGAADSGPRTETGAVVGTPSYMAPEQALGKTSEAGPAADIHALGAILYVLLTGRPPFQGVTVLDTLEQVCSQEPVPPSRLQPKVPRDLETICLKCLAKETHKRYATAEDLAEDLRRYQAGEPIVARPVRAWERGFKWARRRPAVAGLLALVLVVAALGFGLVTWKWQEAESYAAAEAVARSQAETERHEAIKERKKAQDQKKQADAARRQAEDNRQTALGAVDVFYKIADVYYQALERSPQLKASGMETLRKNLLTVAVLFSDPGLAMQYSGSRLPVDRASTHLRLLKETAPLLPPEEGVGLYQQTLTKIEAMARRQPAVQQYQGLLGQIRMDMGDLYRDQRRFDLAAKAYQTALTILKRRVAKHPAQPHARYDLSLCYNKMAYFQTMAHRLDLTEDYCLKAQKILEKLGKAQPRTAVYDWDLAVCFHNVGWAYQHTSRPDLAEKAYHQALAIRQQLVRAYPKNDSYQSGVAHTLANLATLHYSQRGLDQAEKTWDKALVIRQNLAKTFPDFGPYQIDLAITHQQLGKLYQETGRPEQAEKTLRTVVALRDQLARRYPTAGDHALELARSYVALASCLDILGRPQQAVDFYGRAIAILEKWIKQKQPPDETRPLLAQAFWCRGLARSHLDTDEEALADVDQAIRFDSGKDRQGLLADRALFLVRLGRHRQAVKEAEDLLGKGKVPRRSLYVLACVYARATAAVAGDTKLATAERDTRAEKYAAQAVRLLTQAKAAGLFQLADFLAKVKIDPNLNALRRRDGFKSLLAALEPLK